MATSWMSSLSSITSAQLVPLSLLHTDELAAAVAELAAHSSGQRLWWAANHYGRADATRFVHRALRDRAASQGDVWALQSGTSVLGLFSLKHLDWVHGCAQVGYWLRPRAQGQGLATAGLKALAQQARARGLVRLEFMISSDNAASQAVARRCGAIEEGRLRNRLLVQGNRCDAVLFGWWLGVEGPVETRDEPVTS